MNPRSITSMFAAACVAAASAAHALPLNDRASFEFFAGGNVGMPGAFRSEFNSPGPDGPTLYQHLGFDDVYHSNYTGGAEFDYAVDSHLSAFARAAYSKFDGANREVGALFSDTGRQVINAQFGDANTKELDLGARYTFLTGEKWRPFLGAAIGASRNSATTAMVSEPGGAPTTRVELARESTVLEERVETGLQYSPARNLDLRLTAAASHLNSGRPSGDANLALLGLEDANRGMVRGHWDFPAEVGAVWHF